ncbi:hypothetical protein LINGRAHAP2_LOCUS13342 [Linum grandiflorum]
MESFAYTVVIQHLLFFCGIPRLLTTEFCRRFPNPKLGEFGG